MAAVRKNVTVQVGTFLRAKTHVLTAVEDKDKETSLNNVCVGIEGSKEHAPHAPAGIKQPQVCPVCKNDDKTTHKKARKEGDTYALVDTDELEKIATEAKGNQNLMEFTVHAASDFDGVTLNADKVYFLEPEAGDKDAYALLARKIEERSDIVALTVWSSRSVPALYRLVTYKGVLAVQKIAWPGQIAEVPANDGTFSEKDADMADKLLDMAVSPFDLDSYRDTRGAALQALIAQAQGVPGAEVPSDGKPAPAAPVNGGLSAMLEAALAAAGAPAEETKPAAKKKAAPRKKAAAAA